VRRTERHTGIVNTGHGETVESVVRGPITRSVALAAGGDHTISTQGGGYHVDGSSATITSATVRSPSVVGGDVVISGEVHLTGAGCTINGKQSYDGTGYMGAWLRPGPGNTWIAIPLGKV
jgi:hypothetical protein